MEGFVEGRNLYPSTGSRMHTLSQSELDNIWNEMSPIVIVWFVFSPFFMLG